MTTVYRFIAAEKAEPVRFLCRVLGVARAAFYAWKAGSMSKRARNDARILVHIRAATRRTRGVYGSPRVTAELRAEGLEVGRRRVARLMRQEGLCGVPRRRFRGGTTNSKHDRPVPPNLLGRDFSPSAPNKVWASDITYLPTAQGWVYLAVVLDLFSRKVVGWSLASHMRDDLCIAALERAATTRQPGSGLIHHSDRGVQYASTDYVRALAVFGAQRSMSGKGDCWDNACVESFFGTLKQEMGETDWANEREARSEVGKYIHRFYNTSRRHSTLGQVSPVAFEAAYRAQQSRAA